MKNPTKMEISSASRGQRKLAEQSAEELFGVLNDRQSAPLSLDQLTTRFLVAITRARQHSSVEPDTGMEKDSVEKEAPSALTHVRQKYRKRPVVIEAVQFDGTPGGAVAVYNVFDISESKFIPENDFNRGRITIPTKEGVMTATADDWIIRGVKGEYYPCKPDIFEATYEKVSVGACVSSPAEGVAASENLSACPFCSDNNATVMRDAQHMAPYFIVICADCGARTESFQEAKVARVRWNDRASAGRAAQDNGVALERLVRCARANSYTGIPSLVAVMLALPALHHMNGMEGIERLACGVIGVIIGWLAALWATYFLLKYGGSAPNRRK